MINYLREVVVIGTEDFLDTFRLFKQLGHGARTVKHVALGLLLIGEEFGQVVPEAHFHLKPTKCTVKSEI